MKKTTIVCDACSKQVEQGYFKEANFKFYMNEWRGGSLGGSEDDYIFKGDLCQSCAHKLKDFLEKELGLKEVRK